MIRRLTEICCVALIVFTFPIRSGAADPAGPGQRPRITGLAHVGLYVTDIGRARQFYKDFFGYEEPFFLNNSDGSLNVTWIKINDRQFIELRPEKTAGTDRLEQVGFETDDAEGLRVYLKSKGVAVPDQTTRGQSGTANFDVTDPDGHKIEFVQYLPGSWVAQDFGKHLPAARVSLRMPHAGIMVHDLAAAQKFYGDILGFKETWRGSKPPGRVLSWVNLQVPDGKDYAELMLYGQMPALARITTLHHVCLEVADVPKTGELLTARPLPKASKPATAVAVGVNGKRQINYYDPDGTRVEVMEPTTADGKPVPPSTAPPPGSGSGS